MRVLAIRGWGSVITAESTSDVMKAAADKNTSCLRVLAFKGWCSVITAESTSDVMKAAADKSTSCLSVLLSGVGVVS